MSLWDTMRLVMDIMAMPKALSILPHSQKELIPSQRTIPPKPTGSKGIQIPAWEGVGNTAEVSSSSDHLLDTITTQKLYGGSNLALH